MEARHGLHSGEAGGGETPPPEPRGRTKVPTVERQGGGREAGAAEGRGVERGPLYGGGSQVHDL